MCALIRVNVYKIKLEIDDRSAGKCLLSGATGMHAQTDGQPPNIMLFALSIGRTEA